MAPSKMPEDAQATKNQSSEEHHDSTNPSPMEHDDDDTFDDADSALGDDGLSTQTQSLASSIFDYRHENGRCERPRSPR